MDQLVCQEYEVKYKTHCYSKGEALLFKLISAFLTHMTEITTAQYNENDKGYGREQSYYVICQV